MNMFQILPSGRGYMFKYNQLTVPFLSLGDSLNSPIQQFKSSTYFSFVAMIDSKFGSITITPIWSAWLIYNEI